MRWRRSWYSRRSFAGLSSAPLSPGLGGENRALKEEGKGSHSDGVTAHGPWGRPPSQGYWLCGCWSYGSFWSRSQHVSATSGRALGHPRLPQSPVWGRGLSGKSVGRMKPECLFPPHPIPPAPGCMKEGVSETPEERLGSSQSPRGLLAWSSLASRSKLPPGLWCLGNQGGPWGGWAPGFHLPFS